MAIMRPNDLIFEARFRNSETDKEISHFIILANPDEWEQALKIARAYEDKSETLFLTELKLLGMTIDA